MHGAGANHRPQIADTPTAPESSKSGNGNPQHLQEMMLSIGLSCLPWWFA
jgi:hypothetical protein